jgi:thiamine kinase-like enzyme
MTTRNDSQTPTSVYCQVPLATDAIQKTCHAVFDVLPLVEAKLAEHPRKSALWHFDILKENVIIDTQGAAVALIDWEHIITASLTQVPPWPTFVDS